MIDLKYKKEFDKYIDENDPDLYEDYKDEYITWLEEKYEDLKDKDYINANSLMETIGNMCTKFNSTHADQVVNISINMKLENPYIKMEDGKKIRKCGNFVISFDD